MQDHLFSERRNVLREIEGLVVYFIHPFLGTSKKESHEDKKKT